MTIELLDVGEIDIYVEHGIDVPQALSIIDISGQMMDKGTNAEKDADGRNGHSRKDKERDGGRGSDEQMDGDGDGHRGIDLEISVHV